MLRPTLLVFACLVVSTARGQDSIPATPEYADAAKALDKFIETEMKAKEIPGLAIALVDGDRIVWAKGFGVANPQRKTPATAQTQFPLGSISKPITALIALLLAAEKKLDFDDPVTKHIPDFHPKNPSGTPVKLRHIVAHVSGIVREPPVGNYFEPKNATRAELTKSLNDTTLVYEPGTKYHYSNSAVSMLGHIIETIEKKPFEEVAQERIFGPLGMTRSTYAHVDPAKTDAAMGEGWTRYGKTFPMPMKDYRAIASAGSAMASVTDVGKLIVALCPENKSPISAADLKAAYTTQFPAIKGERDVRHRLPPRAVPGKTSDRPLRRGQRLRRRPRGAPRRSARRHRRRQQGIGEPHPVPHRRGGPRPGARSPGEEAAAAARIDDAARAGRREVVGGPIQGESRRRSRSSRPATGRGSCRRTSGF